jgi:hypothetical protein
VERSWVKRSISGDQKGTVGDSSEAVDKKNMNTRYYSSEDQSFSVLKAREILEGRTRTMRHSTARRTEGTLGAMKAYKPSRTRGPAGRYNTANKPTITSFPRSADNYRHATNTGQNGKRGEAKVVKETDKAKDDRGWLQGERKNVGMGEKPKGQ